jgi:hypothetical protein
MQSWFANLLAATGKTTADLSDTELATQYPVIGLSLAALFLTGIVVDVYLLTRWALARQDRVNLLTLRHTPWSLLEMVIATGIFLFVTFATEVVLAIFLSDQTAVILGTGIVLRGGLLVALVSYFRYRQTDWMSALGLTARPESRWGCSRLFEDRNDAALHRSAATPIPEPTADQLPPACPHWAVLRGAVLYLGIFPAMVILIVGQERLCRALGLDVKPQDIANLFITTHSPAIVALLTVFAVVVAPVFEEVLFRGLAYPVLKQRFGTGRALLMVSAAFALIHFHLPSVVPLFALAIALALAYELTGSLLAAITMHALFNATSVAMLLYVRAHP